MLTSRLLRILRVTMILPVAVFLWTIGWSMMWIGSKKEAHAEGRIDVPVALRNDDDVVWVGTSENICSILKDEHD
jgi:flagellar basal body-associated protein FliL